MLDTTVRSKVSFVRTFSFDQMLRLQHVMNRDWSKTTCGDESTKKIPKIGFLSKLVSTNSKKMTSVVCSSQNIVWEEILVNIFYSWVENTKLYSFTRSNTVGINALMNCCSLLCSAEHKPNKSSFVWNELTFYLWAGIQAMNLWTNVKIQPLHLVCNGKNAIFSSQLGRLGPTAQLRSTH